MTSNSNLIIVGAWNLMILGNKDWIEKFLFPGESSQVSFELQAIKIRTSQLAIQASNSRLLFLPNEGKIENLERIRELAIKLIDYLPHTPVQAMGVNFIFKDEHNPFPVAPVKSAMEKSGLVVASSSGEFTFSALDSIVTLGLAFEGDTVTWNFNFHYPLTDAVSCKGRLTDRSFSDYEKKACELMAQIKGHA